MKRLLAKNDPRMSVLVSYLRGLIQRYDERTAFYDELRSLRHGTHNPTSRDPFVEDATIFLSGLDAPMPPECHMGPLARLVK